jgi:hypothetical protein
MEQSNGTVQWNKIVQQFLCNVYSVLADSALLQFASWLGRFMPQRLLTHHPIGHNASASAIVRTKPFSTGPIVTPLPQLNFEGRNHCGQSAYFCVIWKSFDETEALDGGASDMVAKHRALQFFQ